MKAEADFQGRWQGTVEGLRPNAIERESMGVELGQGVCLP